MYHPLTFRKANFIGKWAKEKYPLQITFKVTVQRKENKVQNDIATKNENMPERHTHKIDQDCNTLFPNELRNIKKMI